MRLRYLGLMLGRSPGEGNGYALLSSCLEDPMDGEAWRLQSVLCLAVQSCPILCDPTDYSPPGSSVHGDFPGKNTGVGYQALLHRIFPTLSVVLSLSISWKPEQLPHIVPLLPGAQRMPSLMIKGRTSSANENPSPHLCA